MADSREIHELRRWCPMKSLLVVALALLLAPSSARAAVQEVVNLANVQSVDLQGDPDNDIRQFMLDGGYAAGTIHIVGTWTNPNAVNNTRPSHCVARATGPGAVVRLFTLSSVTTNPSDGTILTTASLSFEGLDPAGLWSVEFYESIDNAPGLADAVWTDLTIEFEDQNIVANGADLRICQLFGLTMKPSVNLPLQREGDVVGLAMATTSWNVGDRNLIWLAKPDERHPYIAMNLYRIKDDRFEQIGLSWAKHGFNALSSTQCAGFCNRTNGTFLGVGCTDTYSANTNANQSGLGPRFEIDPWSGNFTYAGSMLDLGIPGGDDNITRRLQVHDDDLDPALNIGAEYRYECFYVARDDSDALNNASWKPVAISGLVSDRWIFDQTSSGVAPEDGFALGAWEGARLTTIAQEIPVNELTSPDGRCILGAKVIDEGAGQWRYEFALLNVDMDRQVGRLDISAPFGVQITGMGFSAPLHHDEPLNVPLTEGGVPIDNAPWLASRTPESVVWETTTNPVRWATLYSFWFTADQPPTDQPITIGLFRPDIVSEVAGVTDGPSPPALCVGDSDGDRDVDFDDINTVLAHWLETGPLGDANADGIVNFTDVNAVLAGWLVPCP